MTQFLNWIVANKELVFGGFGTTVVLLAARYVPAVGLRIARLIQPHLASVRTFAPSGKQYNEEFYKYFRQCFEKAERNIYITGDGFECANDEGRRLALDFADMMRSALDSGVSVVRLETKSGGHPDWARELASMKKSYPNSFRLFVYQPNFGSQLSSLCVIDEHSSTRCVVEIMLSTEHKIEGSRADLADTALFMSGRRELAKGVRDRIYSLIDSPSVEEALDHEQVIQLISGSVLYFAYGSNMSRKQMLERISTAQFVGKGYLDGYDLVFDREGSHRPGGVASVVEDAGVTGIGKTWGAIWKIPASSLSRLDEIEDRKAYRRETLSVKMTDAKVHKCEVYISIPQATHIAPEREYLQAIIDGATELGIDKRYLDALLAIDTKEDIEQR